MMDMGKYAFVILGILFNGGASVALKIGMSKPNESVMDLAQNAWVWSGMGLYVLAFGIYAKALQMLPLNLAHPVMTTGAIVAVSVASWLWLGEAWSLPRVAGIGLMVAGMFLLSMGK